METGRVRVEQLKTVAFDGCEKQQVTADGKRVIQVESFPECQEYREVDQDNNGQAAVVKKCSFCSLEAAPKKSFSRHSFKGRIIEPAVSTLM